VKTDKAEAGTTLFVGLNIIATLRTVLYPYLPFASEKIHAMLGLDGEPLDSGWKRVEIRPGSPIQVPAPLFKKLDESVVEEEAARAGVS
jgi:methionyl-tRNA synthetase